MPTHHGSDAYHRGMHAPHSTAFASGTFGRLFPTLPPLFHRDKTHAELREALVRLGARGGPMDPASGAANPDNPTIWAGFAFFGQFIDHDITLDTTSSFERQNDPEGIVNFRTPALELDSVYGSGPEASPHLYQPRTAKLLLDHEHGRDQIARNSADTALIGDPRNDENLVIQQLQLAFIRFHNAVVDAIEPDVAREHLFEEAQRITRWHYQWVVVHEFLPLTVGQALVDEVYDVCNPRAGRRHFNWRHKPFIPVEFSVAAYRFGHSQIPDALRLNGDFNGGGAVPLFDRDELGDPDPDDCSGFGLRAPRRYVDWEHFFKTAQRKPVASKRINPVLAEPLFDLPFVEPSPRASLAVRNLERGDAFGLPSGQAVACAMCLDPLSASDLGNVAADGFDVATPLWYYVLKEAEVAGQGLRLGPVGGRIVAEVLVGLLQGDRLSFVRADPKWTPASEGIGTDADFGMAELLEFAGVA